MATRVDKVLDQLADELVVLMRETAVLTRTFRNDEIVSMESGEPREGADEDEEQARKNYARMKEIEAILNSQHGN